MSIKVDFEAFDFTDNSSNEVRVRSRKAKRTASEVAAVSSSTTRHFVLHDYHDHSKDTIQEYLSTHLERDTFEGSPANDNANQADGTNSKKRRGPRGGVTVPFPTKLHVMLSKVEEDGLEHIVSW